MRKLTMLVVMLLLTLVFKACSDDTHDGEVKIPNSASSFKGKHYEEVIEKLEKSGFTNIQTEKIDDLIFGWLTSYGDVEMLAIDGDEEFKSGAWYAEDAEVIVAYHTFPDKTAEKGKENVTSVSDDEEHNKESDEVATIYEAAVGKMAHDIYSELSVLGYDIEFSHEVTKIDFTSEVLASDESEDYNG